LPLPLGTIDSDALLAFGTIVLAAATCALAYFTRKSSRDAADALNISASQLVETGKAAQLAAAIEVTREYREERLRKARVVVRSLPTHTPGKLLIHLDPEQQDAAFAVSHYLDNLGALVVHDLLTPDAARTFLGSSAIEMWKILAPYIYTERENRGFRIYQIHFEHLAWVMDRVDIEAEMLEKFRGQLMPPAGWRSAG
jgi:hypothetical protein